MTSLKISACAPSLKRGFKEQEENENLSNSHNLHILLNTFAFYFSFYSIELSCRKQIKFQVFWLDALKTTASPPLSVNYSQNLP